jgi:rfaE bifunctional protein nucleotidyltransferase chain/domain
MNPGPERDRVISVAITEHRLEQLVVVGSDHNGVGLKSEVKHLLHDMGKSVIDLGPFSGAKKVDYCDYANAVGQIIENEEAHWGVLICGTGVGMSMVANRFQHVRAALVHSVEVARKSREHNDANVLCLGAWVNSDPDNLSLVRAWFEQPFAQGRHVPRIEKVSPHKGVGIVLTNGVFDIIHSGHIALLEFAKSFGDRLIVAINSDQATRRLKGEGRPVNNEHDRKAVLQSLDCVDEVIIFDGPGPQKVIETVQPDIVVKGAEWPAEEVRRRDSIPAHIEIKVFPLVFEAPGKKYSTSSIIERVHSL